MQATSNPQTNDELVTIMRGMAEMWRREMIAGDPHGDWNPLLILQDDEGTPFVPPISSATLNSDDGKEMLAAIIESIVSNNELRIARAALLVSAYSSLIKPNADGSTVDVADRPRPRDDVNRKEQLLIHVVDRVSEATWWCEIHRSPSAAPTLGDWQRLADDVETGGRFPEALRALQGRRA